MNAVTWPCSVEPVYIKTTQHITGWTEVQHTKLSSCTGICTVCPLSQTWRLNAPGLIWHTPFAMLVSVAASLPRCTMAKHSSGVPSSAVRCMGRQAASGPLLMRARSTYKIEHNCRLPVDLE